MSQRQEEKQNERNRKKEWKTIRDIEKQKDRQQEKQRGRRTERKTDRNEGKGGQKKGQKDLNTFTSTAFLKNPACARVFSKIPFEKTRPVPGIIPGTGRDGMGRDSLTEIKI